MQEDNQKSYFIGLPTPMNAIMIVTFMMFNHQLWGNLGDPRIALVMVVVLGFMMISKIRFSKFPFLSLNKGRSNTISLIGVGVVIVSAVLFRGLVLFPLFSIYIIWSIFQWMLDHDRFEEETEVQPKL
jgi:phosphatidylserine synthase